MSAYKFPKKHKAPLAKAGLDFYQAVSPGKLTVTSDDPATIAAWFAAVENLKQLMEKDASTR